MESVGLFPAGVGNTYLQSLVRPRFHVTEVPTLEVLDSDGAVAQAFTYRQDFSESPTSRYLGIDEEWGTTFSGPVFGCTLGSGTDLSQEKVSPLQDETGIAIILEGSGCPVSLARTMWLPWSCPRTRSGWSARTSSRPPT